MGGVSLGAQLMGTLSAIVVALIVGTVVYLALKFTVGIRLSQDDELRGADVSIHNISAYPEQDIRR
jgi:Amt family ammonium transporter